MKRIIAIVCIVFALQICKAQGNKEYFLEVKEAKIFVKEMGEGKPLILIHGGPGDNHMSFMPYAEELSKDYRVILYDQNNAGKSTSTTEIANTADLEIETLEHLRKHLKLDKLSLVGHSWGTILSLLYAEKHPEHINNITLISSIGTSFQDYIKFATNLQGKFTDDYIKKMQDLSKNPNATQQDMVEVYLPLYFYDEAHLEKLTKTKINFETNRSIITDISQKFNLVGKEEKFKFPILILQGETDMLTAEDMKQSFSKFSDVKIVDIEKSGHFPFIENPEATTKNIKQFFN